MAEIVRYPHLYINGEFVAPHSGRMIESVNPATGEVWAAVAEADEHDVDRAVQAARAAFASGPWAAMTPTDRGHLLRKLADRIATQTDAIARTDTMDNGKVLRESVGEANNAVQWLYYYAGAADKLLGEYLPITGTNEFAYTRREPLGVVGAITPWNSPFILAIWKLAPALAAGNTLVLKPAELTPCSAMELAKLVHECGFPPGVVNIVPGYGQVAGAALSSHPDVDKIAFTGEHVTAQIITRAAADNLKKLHFECGGKSPTLIFPDADLQQALIASTNGIFVNSGQQCSVNSRIFVHESVIAEFTEKFLAVARKIRIGDPLDPRTHQGAVTSKEQLDKIERMVRMGVDEGAQVLCGGERYIPADPRLQGGNYYLPTVLWETQNSMRVCQEEIFGPVTAIMPFRDDEEVLAMANDSKYGLVAGIWTNDVRRAHRLAAKVKAGLVWINSYRRHHWTMPYGGMKISGYGRENGMECLHYYTQVKSVLVDLNTSRPDPLDI